MFPKELLPGYYARPKNDPDGKHRFRRNTRTAKLINDHGGSLVKFRDLPRECQLAMAHYMAIDGEAWDAPEDVYAAYGKCMKCTYSSKAWRTHREAANQKFIDSLPYFIEKYGDVEFGYIAAVPIKTLIESCMADAELAKDYGGLEGWKEYHAWYMGKSGGGAGPKHEAASDLWPVILSSFKDETLQDGWTRFHQYAERHLETCPALFYPHTMKRKGILA